MNSLTSKNEVIQEAIELTSEMELSFPELYQFLDETPVTISNNIDSDITTADFEQYFETLESQMLNYSDTHPQPKHLSVKKFLL